MNHNSYTLSDFDYALPEHLIAQMPPPTRGASRLLDVSHEYEKNRLRDLSFAQLPTLLRAGDLLVYNDTKVIPARIFAHKQTGGAVEILIERVLDAQRALAQVRASKSPQANALLIVNDQCALRVVERDGPFYVLEFPLPHSALQWLDTIGQLPLPPYITHAPGAHDATRYQTVYATHAGAVAAPTAGLHFTQDLLQQLDALGLARAQVTLHVGAGTFQPVRTEDLSAHVMHREAFAISEASAAAINRAKREGRRVIAVGTTSLRALESAATDDGHVDAGARETALFITPGYRFRIVDALITNFHLPKSTLLMLVSAFAGFDTIRAAYAHAIEHEYRFFSYGDAMFLRRT